jgi:hypothetical protein
MHFPGFSPASPASPALSPGSHGRFGDLVAASISLFLSKIPKIATLLLAHVIFQVWIRDDGPGRDDMLDTSPSTPGFYHGDFCLWMLFPVQLLPYLSMYSTVHTLPARTKLYPL